MKFDDLLPFPNEKGAEWLSKIKETASLSLQAKHVSLEWTNELNHYLDLKFDLELKDRLWFIRLLYELVSDTELNILLVDHFSQILTTLLSSEKKVPSNCGLKLDWKPMFNIIDLLQKGKRSNQDRFEKSFKFMIPLIRSANRFFDVDDWENVLKRFLPEMHVGRPEYFISSVAYLSLFLPTAGKFKNRGWLPCIFNIWKMSNKAAEMDMYCMNLFSRLAYDQRFDPICVGWNEEHVKHIFTLTINNLDFLSGDDINSSHLPNIVQGDLIITEDGGYQYMTNLPPIFGTSIWISLARFVIYTIYPKDSGFNIKTLDHLTDLLAILESFCHPSNSGSWTIGIFTFLSYISSSLLQRINMEKKKDCLVPTKYRLTNDIIEKLTKMVLPLAILGVYGKDVEEIDAAQSCLKFLSYCAPELVFPKVLPMIYSSLDNLTNTHRTSSSIALMVLLSPAMLRNETYKIHLIQLLYRTIPGIDLNDEEKSQLTCLFIGYALMYTPLVDTYADNQFLGSPKHVGQSGREPLSLNVNFDSVMDGFISNSMSGIRTWLVKFLENLFACFRNLSEVHQPGSNALVNSISLLCDKLFCQLSPELENAALEVILENVARVDACCIEPVAAVCGAFAGRTPKKRLAAFVPLCCRHIEAEILQGSGSIPRSNTDHPYGMASLQDTFFHWYQEILMRVCTFSGAGLLVFQEQIHSTLEKMIDKVVSKLGFVNTGQLLANILHSLTFLYPAGFSSHPESCWNDPIFLQNAHEHWGELLDWKKMKADWHIPSPKEKEFACKLIDMCLSKIFVNLYDLISPSNVESGSQKYLKFQKWLQLFQACFSSTAAFLKPRNNSRPEIIDSHCYWKPSVFLECMYVFDDPESAEYKFWEKRIEEMEILLLSVGNYYLENCLDDTDGCLVLIWTIRACVSCTFDLDQETAMISNAKPLIVIPGDSTNVPRYVRLIEIYQHYLKRMVYSRVQKGLDERKEALVHILIQLCLSKYLSVGKVASNDLLYILSEYSYLKEKLFEKLLEYVEKEKLHTNEIKLSLVILHEPAMLQKFILRKKEHLYRFSKALIHLRMRIDLESDDLQMAEDLCNILTDFITVSRYEHEVSDKIISIASETKFENPDLLTRLENHRTEYCKRNEVLLNDYFEFLLSHVEGDFHWAIGSHVAKIFTILIHDMKPIHPKLTQFAFKNVIHDHLQVRQDCLKLSNEILCILRRRAKKNGNYKGKNVKHTIYKTEPQYLSLIGSSFDWERNIISLKPKPEYIDKVQVGWFCWSDNLEFSEGFIDGDQYSDPDSLETVNIIDEFIKSSDFWNRFTSLGLLATDETFNDENTSFLNSLASFKQDGLVETILPFLKALLADVDDSFAQKSGAEIITGLIYGSKYWSLANSETMIDEFLPLIQQAIDSSDISRLEYWKTLFNIIFYKRDPARYIRIIKQLEFKLFERVDLQSFVTLRKKIFLVLAVVGSLRCDSTFSDKVLEQLISMGDSPYQEVREAIAYGIDICTRNYSRLLDMNFPTIESFLECVDTISRWKPHPFIVEYLDSLQTNNTPVPLGQNRFNSNIGKTMLTWMYQGGCGFSRLNFLPYYSRLLRYNLSVSESLQPDLQEMANAVLKFIPHYVLPIDMISETILFILDLLKDETYTDYSWHMKIKALNFLHVFYLKHLVLIPVEMREIILQVLLMVIENPQLEDTRIQNAQWNIEMFVATQNCINWSRIVLIKDMMKKKLFSAKLLDRKLKRTPEYAAALVKRHSAILVLSSLFLAFPYGLSPEIKPYVIAVAECLNEPSPIQESVRYAFNEFKRTHQDNWENDKKLFTEDELYSLTDLLISPSYYA